MGVLIFTLRASSLSSNPLSLCFGRPNHLVKQFFLKMRQNAPKMLKRKQNGKKARVTSQVESYWFDMERVAIFSQVNGILDLGIKLVMWIKFLNASESNKFGSAPTISFMGPIAWIDAMWHVGEYSRLKESYLIGIRFKWICFVHFGDSALHQVVMHPHMWHIFVGMEMSPW